MHVPFFTICTICAMIFVKVAVLCILLCSNKLDLNLKVDANESYDDLISFQISLVNEHIVCHDIPILTQILASPKHYSLGLSMLRADQFNLHWF